MSGAAQIKYRRTHNILLVNKLLNCRENASPFTLVLDPLEQAAAPLVSEMMRRASHAKTKVIYVSFEAVRAPPAVDLFIPGLTSSLADLQSRITAALDSKVRNLLVFAPLNPLIPKIPNLPAFFSSLMNPATSLLATYHADVPLFPSPQSHTPHPLTLLHYLATTLLTTHSLSQVLTQKAARDRSIAEPQFGLGEEIEGVLVGMGANDPRGMVVEMEHRRKSGRSVREWFFLPPAGSRKGVGLLEDHPLYSSGPSMAEESMGGEDSEGASFSLGLTDKQRRDREGVVLPYFDAQQGGGEGGRILYDMGAEDDFDEEEDEI